MNPPASAAPRGFASETAVYRIEVRARDAKLDSQAQALRRDAAAVGVELSSAATARVYLIQAPLTADRLETLRTRLLSDPIIETSFVGHVPSANGAVTVEVHPQPGVMDPVAQSVREAVRDLLESDLEPAQLDLIQISTGRRYDMGGVTPEAAALLARRLLANPVIHQIHAGPWHPRALPRGAPYELRIGHVLIRDLTDDQLVKLSREAHLFLSLDEMKAIREEYRTLGREPTDIEIETIAQTWSEHCVHKTLKSTVVYREEGGEASGRQGVRSPASSTPRRLDASTPSFARRSGHTLNPDGSVTIKNLLKSTVAAATHELIADGVDWALSVFKDNSGVIAFDDSFGICIKVETHNHPSAIEPYGGAATGAGGCIRDVIGTGLGAKPIANTDVFCVAFPDRWQETPSKSAPADHGKPISSNSSSPPRSSATSAFSCLPPGTLPPRRILTDIVAGVRDYGNRMGIPTVNGAVYFDDRYVGNPLVFCGCIGLIPRHLIRGQSREGDLIVALGGRTGRDGVHGATFSSAEMEHTHADEFGHAVQIGNAIEEKRLLDAILRARDGETERRSDEVSDRKASATSSLPFPATPSLPLFSAITDCGAGGFSSAVGEMGSALGATVDLDCAPLKYDGLSYTEIWISEAQERMVMAVPPANLPALQRICDEENVELAVLGTFGTPKQELILRYRGTEVGRLPMEFLHEGIPTPTREAVWRRSETANQRDSETGGSGSLSRCLADSLFALLSHPNIASKHWIIRQYDHEVQGNTIVKPLVGPGTRGPGDAAVLEPIPGSERGIAIACGLQTGVGDPALGGDPYRMALAGIDEAVRNLVCIGADPSRIAILDNFCWPGVDNPEAMGALVRACEGCYDGAKAYRTPFVSGKDSLNNQLRYVDAATGESRVVRIPPTLLITGVGIVPEIARCTTMDAKSAGNLLVLVGGPTTGELGASHLLGLGGLGGTGVPPVSSSSGHAPTHSPPSIPSVDLTLGPAAARAVHAIIRAGLARSAHDCSDGGMLTAVAEMLIATTGATPSGRPCSLPLGCELIPDVTGLSPLALAFAENPSRYILEIRPTDLERTRKLVLEASPVLQCRVIGTLNTSGRLTWRGAALDESVERLADAWLRPLDW